MVAFTASVPVKVLGRPWISAGPLAVPVNVIRAMPPADGSDISALADNRIAVTPLRLDMTDEPFLTRLAKVFD